MEHNDSAATLHSSLKGHYLFAALTPQQWQQLQAHVRPRHLKEGVRLFSQNDDGHHFFIVIEGGVRLSRTSSRGLEKIMRLVGPGQSFAESVLFSDPPRYPVDARSVDDTLLVQVERNAYLALLRESFDACRAVMAKMVERIYAHWDEIEALSLHDSHVRVARYLLRQLHASGVDETIVLPARKGMIAARLGLAPETFSRVLRGLADSGRIAVEGQRIEILDLEGLSCVAQV